MRGRLKRRTSESQERLARAALHESRGRGRESHESERERVASLERERVSERETGGGLNRQRESH